MCMLAAKATGAAAAQLGAPAANAVAGTQWDAQFAEDLIRCIREVAAEVASYSPPAFACATAEEVLDERAELLGRVLAPHFETHGQAAALWCAVYATPPARDDAAKVVPPTDPLTH